MDSVKLHVGFFFFLGCVLSMCLALDCDWSVQYEYNERCCQICSSGTYPTHHCNGTSQSVCVSCSGNTDSCFCNNNLCSNKECSQCTANPLCKRGEERIRKGSYKFKYSCRPCLNQTYSDEEGKMCRPISDCRKSGSYVIFPGNQTHNARCGTPENQDLVSYNGLVVGLALMSLAFLAMFIYLCFQRMREERKKKKHRLTSSSVKAPSDECVCKLSKEEIGEV